MRTLIDRWIKARVLGGVKGEAAQPKEAMAVLK
jgi:hypothetical protein